MHKSLLACTYLPCRYVARSAVAAGVYLQWASKSFSNLNHNQDYTPPDDLRQSKSQKKLILTGASRFNIKPKTGISFLEDNKLIYTDPNEPRAHSLAVFLKDCTRLDKRLLGDFISKPENIEVLKAFISLFDFQGVRQSF